MVVILASWVGECCRASLALELLFLSQTLNNFLLGYFSDTALCQWERVTVVWWAEDGCDPSGWEG